MYYAMRKCYDVFWKFSGIFSSSIYCAEKVEIGNYVNIGAGYKSVANIIINTLNLKFPNINIFTSQELIPNFIRGYVDGDGCLTYTKTGRLVVEIIGTKEFLSTIVDRYSKIFTPALHKDKRHLESNTYFISCACDKADEFATLLYANANIYLDRKYDRFAVLRRNS